MCVGVAATLLLAACASSPPSGGSGAKSASPGPHYKIGRPYRIKGRLYHPAADEGYDAVGMASWYGAAFQGKKTANGEIFDRRRLSAAHKTLPLPSFVEVENLENGRRVTVRVNDRGPFVDDRLIDLSEAAAEALGFRVKGLAKVRVRYAGEADIGALAALPGGGPPRVAALGAPPAPSRRPAAATAASMQTPPQPRLAARAFWVEIARFEDLQALEQANGRLDAAAKATVFDIGGGADKAPPARYALRLGPYDAASDADAALARAVAAGFAKANVLIVQTRGSKARG